MQNIFANSGRAGKWLQLAMYSVLIWVSFAYIIPCLYDLFPAFRHSRNVQEQYDISAGAIYYTDVPVSLDAEMANREAVQRALQMRAAKMK